MMNIAFKPLAFTMALIGTAAQADPQEDAQYIVDQTVTKEMFEGALTAMGPTITGAIENQFRQQGISLTDPDRFYELFLTEFIDEFTQSMRDQSAELYLEILTEQELADIAAFYATESGQSLIKSTPALMLAGAELGERAGVQAGMNAGARLADRIESEGLIVVDDPSLLEKILNTLR